MDNNILAKSMERAARRLLARGEVHKAIADEHLSISKTHGDLAEAHAHLNKTVAACHERLSKCHKTLATHHEALASPDAVTTGKSRSPYSVRAFTPENQMPALEWDKQPVAKSAGSITEHLAHAMAMTGHDGGDPLNKSSFGGDLGADAYDGDDPLRKSAWADIK